MGKHSKVSWGKLIGRLSPYNIKKAVLYLKHYGPKEFAVKLTERFEHTDVDYPAWFQAHQASEQELQRQCGLKWQDGVSISITVPLYRTPELFLRQMIESVTAQTYPYWELCLADGSGDTGHSKAVVQEYARTDKRIKYKILDQNLGISQNTNAAFEMASGEYVALLDHDDLLAPDALYEIAMALKKQPKTEVLYTDEDKVTSDLSEHFQPHFKPDFNLDLLRSNNYICHMFVVKRRLLNQLGGLSKEFDGAQDHDFILRCTEQAEGIIHIPKVLYHWRIHSGSTADNPASKMYAFDAGKRAVTAHLNRMGVSGTVTDTKDLGFYRVNYQVEGEPLVSIIIPNKDHIDLLEACLKSIMEKSTYRNYEIIIVENNSKKEETFQFYKKINGQKRIQVVYWDREFNYSAINNYGILKSSGEYIICLNNDITVITPEWIEEFLGHCQRTEVGVVGARLYYPDNTIQHGGIVVGIGGIAGSVFVGMARSRTGYLHKARLQQDLSAVTAACMMVKRSVYKEVHGFEEKLAVAFNDVDFCLKVGEAGYLVVYNPYVEMYHDESKTRGPEDTKEKVRRFQREIEYMRTRWIKILKQGDPYYNPNFSLKTWNYELKNDV